MQITINRVNHYLHFEAANEAGNTVHIDGESQGMRPMQLLLTSVATCAAFDVVEILKKQRQTLHDIQIEVNGKRAEDQTPKPFTEIHIHFLLFGEVEPPKAERAVQLAVEKYCSVGASLHPDIAITHSFEIKPFAGIS